MFCSMSVLSTMVALINSGLYIPQSVSLSYMKVIHYGLRHEGVPERYFLSNISEGGGSTHGGEIFVRATRIQDGGSANTAADRIRPNINVDFVNLNFCIKPIIRSSLFMSIILLRFAFIWKFFESMCSYPTTGLDKTFSMKTYFNIYFLATSKRQLFTQTYWVWDTSNNPNQCHSKKCSGKNLFAIIQFKTIICFTTSKLAISWAGQEKVKMRARTSQATLLNF